MTLYASKAGPLASSDLYTIDPGTGVATSIASMSVALTGMAMDPTTSVMYGATSNSSNNSRSLVTVDLVTGATTVIGQFLEGASVRQPSDIAFDASGQLWGWSSFTGRLLYIDKATGATRTYGSTFIGSQGNGLDFDWQNHLFVMPKGDDDTLFAVDTTLPPVTPVIPGVELAGGAGSDDLDETYAPPRAVPDRTGTVTAITTLAGTPSSGGASIAAAAMQDDKFYIIINEFGSPVWLATTSYYGDITTIGLTLDGIDALATDDPGGRSNWYGVNPYPLVEDWEAARINDRWEVYRLSGRSPLNPNKVFQTQVIPDLDDLDEILDVSQINESWFELSSAEQIEGAQSLRLNYKHPTATLSDRQQLVYRDPRGGAQDVEYWLAYGFLIPDWSIVWNSDSEFVELPDFRVVSGSNWNASTGLGNYLINDTGPTNGIFVDWDGGEHPISAGLWHELRMAYKKRSSDGKIVVTMYLDDVLILDHVVSTYTGGGRPYGIQWNAQYYYKTSYYPTEPPESMVYIDPLVWSTADPGKLFNSNFIEPPFIDKTTTAYVPTLSPGIAPVDIPFIDPAGEAFTPALTFTNIFAPFISPTAPSPTPPRLLLALRARISQEPVEVVIQGDSAARISQEPIEVLVQGDSAGRVSQVPIEVLVQHTYEIVNVILLDWQVGSA